MGRSTSSRQCSVGTVRGCRVSAAKGAGLSTMSSYTTGRGRHRYEETVKEVGYDHHITTSFTGDLTREFIIDFFGLTQPDEEWYKIRTEEEGR